MRVWSMDVKLDIFTSAAAFMLQCAAALNFHVNVPLDYFCNVSSIGLSSFIDFG